MNNHSFRQICRKSMGRIHWGSLWDLQQCWWDHILQNTSWPRPPHEWALFWVRLLNFCWTLMVLTWDTIFTIFPHLTCPLATCANEMLHNFGHTLSFNDFQRGLQFGISNPVRQSHQSDWNIWVLPLADRIRHTHSSRQLQTQHIISMAGCIQNISPFKEWLGSNKRNSDPCPVADCRTNQRYGGIHPPRKNVFGVRWPSFGPYLFQWSKNHEHWRSNQTEMGILPSHCASHWSLGGTVNM